jgi:hypothetical protein
MQLLERVDARCTTISPLAVLCHRRPLFPPIRLQALTACWKPSSTCAVQAVYAASFTYKQTIR